MMLALQASEESLHTHCLRELRAARYVPALRLAMKRWHLSPDAVAARLLAVCYLRLGRFNSARKVLEFVQHTDS
jgi:Flp pilus assembly protein TadD